MSLVSGSVTVGTAPTLINGAAHNNWVHFRISNNDNTDTVYIGGSNVTAGNGIPLLKLETFDIDLAPGNRIYAISTKAGHTVSWVRQEL